MRRRHTRRRAGRTVRVLASLCAGALVAGGAGCFAVELAAVAAESYKRSSTHEIKAEYRGLEGKTYAVFISADRILQAEHPQLVKSLTMICAERLRLNVDVTGYVPPDTILMYMANNPRWVMMSGKELADEMGVERLVMIEVTEFRLHEPGNSYLWAGRAAATVNVLEADGPINDEYVFRKSVAVAFPDDDGVGPNDMSATIVATRLQTRLVDRATWLFYDHQEPYYPDY